MAAVIRSAFAAQREVLDPPASALRETAENVVARLRLGGGAVAEAHGRMVGAILWEPADGGLYVGRVSVVPGWRGRGVARALMEQAEVAAGAAGFSRVWLSVRLVLAGNRRVFAAAGYVETVQHAHPGYAVATFVDMEKHLPARTPGALAPGTRVAD